VLGEHLQYASVWRQLTPVGIFRQIIGEPEFLAHLVDGVELVGAVLIGTEYSEVDRVFPHYIAQQHSQRPGVSEPELTWFRHIRGVATEIRHAQVLAQQAAVGVGIGAHPPWSFRGQCLQLRHQAPLGIEQLIGFVASQPVLQLLEVGRIVMDSRQRHLMGPPEPLDLVAIDLLRTGPAFGCA
jgi:hypothetical protein